MKVPALYWHPKRNIVVKVDHKRKLALTVLSPRLLEETRHQTKKVLGVMRGNG